MRQPILFLFPTIGLFFLGVGCQSSPPMSPEVSLPKPIFQQMTNAPEAAPQSQKVSVAASSTPSTFQTPSKKLPLAFPGILPDRETAQKRIRIKTEKGDILFALLPSEGPKAASNFIYLVKQKFYDGLTFHRVESGFVVQGGDPSGNGTGGPGYTFEDDGVRLPYTEGIVAMANRGPNTNGSQFFIMLADAPLPPSYSIFGRVVQGMDVVKKIQKGDRMLSVLLES